MDILSFSSSNSNFTISAKIANQCYYYSESVDITAEQVNCIRHFISAHKKKFTDFDIILATRGPAAFTGVRTSLSVIKALKLFCCNVKTVNNFDVLKKISNEIEKKWHIESRPKKLYLIKYDNNKFYLCYEEGLGEKIYSILDITNFSLREKGENFTQIIAKNIIENEITIISNTNFTNIFINWCKFLQKKWNCNFDLTKIQICNCDDLAGEIKKINKTEKNQKKMINIFNINLDINDALYLTKYDFSDVWSTDCEQINLNAISYKEKK